MAKAIPARAESETSKRNTTRGRPFIKWTGMDGNGLGGD